MEIFGVYLVNQSSGNTVPLLTDQDNIIGRGVPKPEGEKGRVLLPHPSISKFHAKILLDSKTHEWKLLDTSRHGLFVNDKKVEKEVKLRHGDKIKIGPFILMFYEKFKADDETAEQPLVVSDQQSSRLQNIIYIMAAFILEMPLAYILPQYTLILSFALIFFALPFIMKTSWRNAAKIAIATLMWILLIGIVGVGLSIYFLPAKIPPINTQSPPVTTPK